MRTRVGREEGRQGERRGSRRMEVRLRRLWVSLEGEFEVLQEQGGVLRCPSLCSGWMGVVAGLVEARQAQERMVRRGEEEGRESLLLVVIRTLAAGGR